MLPGLNDSELRLLHASRLGNVADLTGMPDPVRSEIFRHMLLRLPDEALPASLMEARSPRWVIRGARFDSRIDLRDGRGQDGSPIAALEFIGCTFSDGINADGARFERLRIEDCRFVYEGCEDAAERRPPATPISLRNVVIEGELRLKNIAPCEPAGLLWLHAKAIRVGTNVRFENVRLRAPSAEAVRQDGTTRYALDFDGAKVSGHMKLHPGVRAEGGVRMQSCRIDGNLWCDGLRATDGETPQTRQALLNQSFDIRFAFDAQVAEIGGVFVMRAYSAGAGETCHAVIEGSIRLLRLQVKGGLYLDGLEVNSVPVALASPDASASAASVPAAPVPAASVPDGAVAQDPGTPAEAAPDAPKAGDAAEAPNVWFRTAILMLAHAEVGGVFSCEPLNLPTSSERPFMGRPGEGDRDNDLPEGKLDMSGMRIQGDAVIDADLGDITLEGCAVGGNLQLLGSVARIEAPRLNIGGDTMLSVTVKAPYLVNLRRSQFQGLFDMSGLRFDEESRLSSATPHIHLRGSTIGRTFAVKTYPPLFDNAKAAELKCWPGHTIVEVQVRKDPDSEADRGRGDDPRYATFLYCQRSGQAAVVDGSTLYPTAGNPLSALQQISAPAFKHMDWNGDDADEVVWDYLRLYCACLAVVRKGHLRRSDFFSVAEKPEDLPASLRGRVQVNPLGAPQWHPKDSPLVCTVRGFIRARGVVSEVSFIMHRDGLVQLDDENPVLNAEVDEERRYERPFRFGSGASYPEYSPLAEGRHIGRIELERMIPKWREKLTPSGRLAGTRVDLRDVTCTTLQDEGGSVWGDVKLSLENFTYSRIVSSVELLDRTQGEIEQRKRFLSQRPSDEYFDLRRYAQAFLHQRIPGMRAFRQAGAKTIDAAETDMRRWLDPMPEDTLISSLPITGLRALLQELKWDYEERWVLDKATTNKPIWELFQPQPYAQLAKVVREQGDDYGTREIEREKIALHLDLKIANERKAARAAWERSSLRQGLWRFTLMLKSIGWNWLYGWGFGYGLSLGKAARTLAICWLVGWASVAFVNRLGFLTASTSTVAVALANTPYGDMPVLLRTSATGYVEELPCGGNINQLLYAVETFTPLLNLRQESRCDIRSPHPTEHMLSAPRWLEFLKFLYEVAGYLITSLAVLTFSGIARRWDQS